MNEKSNSMFLSYGADYYTEDFPLQQILRYSGLKYNSELGRLGKYVSTEFLEALDFIDHYGKPYLEYWNSLGERIDHVRISPEHRRILDELFSYGIVRKVITGEESWLYHFISGYIISDSGIFCTVTLTMQTAYALNKFGDGAVREKYLPRYLSREKPWMGATFYTELQGGSDLGSNTTKAELVDGKWHINGPDKYFASNAGLADGAIVTAKPVPVKSGAKGISIFFVPACLDDGVHNYRIRRLKNKIGTIAVPTGEVEMENSVGFLLGKPAEGIYGAMDILMISRLDNAFAALGISRKALWEAFLYASSRKSFGSNIIEHPLLRRDFLEMEADLEGSTILSVKAAEAFNRSANDHFPYSEEYHYARILTHISKNITASLSDRITRYSMEIFGGIGFLEEFPIAKFHRDAIVTPIWEGTSNIQALEMYETIVKKNSDRKLLETIRKLVNGFSKEIGVSKTLLSRAGDIEKRLKELAAMGNDAQYYLKNLLDEFGHLFSSSLLFDLHVHSPEEDRERTGIMAEIYYIRNVSHGEIPVELLNSARPLEWMFNSRRISGN